MSHFPILDELAIIAALSVVVTVLLARLKLPVVAGLLLAGALAGPHGFAFVRSGDSIEVLAEVGVVLLLFTIGLEFSFSRLTSIFKQVAIGGVLQVGLTIAATAAVAMAFGQPFGRSVFFGFVVSLSSTAIVLRALTERQELDAPHGRVIVGTLIFQDLCVVPMVLLVPLLANHAPMQEAAVDVALALSKAAIVVVAAPFHSRFVVPRALAFVDASRSRDLFLLAILAICIGTAWLTSLAGLSLALGAFLGGMVVADTEYGHRAMGDMLPLRDALVSVFFVSLGMLFDIRIVLTEPLLVGGLLAAFLFAKGMLATLAAAAMRFPARVSWLVGIGLAQFGEFGFVLVRLGEDQGIVTGADVKPMLAAGVVSMFVTPLLVHIAPHVTAGERLLAPLERLLGVRSLVEVTPQEGPTNHVVIVGFGLAGRHAARALEACHLRYLAMELNADTVRKARGEQRPVYYGDATSEETLRHARLPEARALVILINDPAAVRRILDTALRVAPNVPVLVRSRYLNERSTLMEEGAYDVVADEVEGAVEMLVRLLRSLEVPRNVIDERIRALRNETGPAQRKQTLPRPEMRRQRALDELRVDSFLVREGMMAVGHSAAELRLRSLTGALIIAVKRGDTLMEKPDPTAPFASGDIIFFVGSSEAVRAAAACLESGCVPLPLQPLDSQPSS